MRICDLCRLNTFFIRCIQLAVTNVFHNRAGEQVRILQNHAECSAKVAFFDAANIDAVIGDFTLVNIIEPVDKVGYRRFAGTGGADKRDLLSALCIEGNIV